MRTARFPCHPRSSEDAAVERGLTQGDLHGLEHTVRVCDPLAVKHECFSFEQSSGAVVVQAALNRLNADDCFLRFASGIIYNSCRVS